MARSQRRVQEVSCSKESHIEEQAEPASSFLSAFQTAVSKEKSRGITETWWDVTAGVMVMDEL